MSEASSPLWNIKPATRLDRTDPYLLLQQVTLFVRDQERSLRFFRDGLGFNVALDYTDPEHGRWVMVAPPDGTARIALVAPLPGSDEHALIGKARQIVFLTENVEAKYREWNERGVRFDRAPETALYGSVLASFEDVDGNRFSLIEFNQATRLVEEQRRMTEEILEAERRAAQEQEIARQVQARLFPQRMPAAEPGICGRVFAGEACWRGLLRFSGFGTRAAGAGDWRHCGKGNACGAFDGEFAGEFSKPVRDCGR